MRQSTNSGSATNDAVLALVALFFRMFTKFYFGELSKDPPPSCDEPSVFI